MEETIKHVLNEMEERSLLEKSKSMKIPPNDRMLAITADTGKFFNILLKAMNAKNILEVGTSTGYSTIWFAEAIKENSGKIITIEKNPDKVTRARKNFEQAQVSEMIQIREGLAERILSELSNEGLQNHFDFALIDSDKKNSIKYFDLILPLIKKGGIIATDNILYPEKYRNEMQALIDHIKKKPNVVTVTVPVGNGEEITIKTSD